MVQIVQQPPGIGIQVGAKVQNRLHMCLGLGGRCGVCERGCSVLRLVIGKSGGEQLQAEPEGSAGWAGRDETGVSVHETGQQAGQTQPCARWYFNVVIEVEADAPAGQDKIGIDLGLKDTATCSDGTKLEAGRFYRDLESKLAVAQRARKKKRAKNIHAKIANRRKDALHKFSRQLVNCAGEIYVGNVKSSVLREIPRTSRPGRDSAASVGRPLFLRLSSDCLLSYIYYVYFVRYD